MPTKTAPPEPEAVGDVGPALRSVLDVMDDDFKDQNLFVKIARISGYLGAVPKRGYNAFHKYNYVMESDLVGAVRQFLAVAGIVIIPNVVSRDQVGDVTSVDVEYTVTDGQESFTFTIPGAGADRGDKGIYKAMTGSQKYAIMKLFKIETGDDPEGDTRVDERAASSSAPAEPPTVRQGARGGVQRGGHTDLASPVQLRRISEQVKLLDWDRSELLAFVKLRFSIEAPTELPEDDKAASKIVVDVLKTMTATQAGELVSELSERITALEERVRDEAGGDA